MSVWFLRIVWASLPITAGPAAADALDSWSTSPQVVAAVLLWSAWGLVLTGVLTPRPVALTAVRIAAPGFFVLAVVVAMFDDTTGGAAIAALVATGAAVALAVTPGVAVAAANGVAYGDERRFPLKTPRVLLLGPLPLAPLLVAAGVAAGPLLVAADRPVVGALALVVGIPLAALMARALHGLSRRWVVLVPAGLVVVDPLTLVDPVLFPRERVVSLRAADPSEPVGPGVVDLRMGAPADSLALTLDRETELLATRRGVRGAVPATTTELRFAAVRSRELLTEAAERRIPVQTA